MKPSSMYIAIFRWRFSRLYKYHFIFCLDVIILFTVPPVYEKYQSQIDGYCGLAKDKVNAVVSAVKAKLPGKKEKAQ